MHEFELFKTFLDPSLLLNLDKTSGTKKVESAISRVSLNLTCVNAWLNFAGCFKSGQFELFISPMSILILAHLPLANVQVKPTSDKTELGDPVSAGGSRSTPLCRLDAIKDND